MKLTSTQLRDIIVEEINEAKSPIGDGGPNHAAFIAKIDDIADKLSIKLESVKSLEKAIEAVHAAADRLTKTAMAASAKIEKPKAEYVAGRSFRGPPVRSDRPSRRDRNGNIF